MGIMNDVKDTTRKVTNTVVDKTEDLNLVSDLEGGQIFDAETLRFKNKPDDFNDLYEVSKIGADALKSVYGSSFNYKILIK